MKQLDGRRGLRLVLLSFVQICTLCLCSLANADTPLPSWNDGAAKKAVVEFVAAVTDQNSKDYVKPANGGLPSEGIPYVVVNGTIVVRDSKVLKGVFPGKPIRLPVQQ